MNAPAPAGELLRRWRDLAAEAEPDLFEGALLVSRLVDPAEDLDAARRAVAALAERVRRSAGGGIDALRRVLFDEEGLRGDRESYDDPSNSSVARVLARRRGMPITPRMFGERGRRRAESLGIDPDRLQLVRGAAGLAAVFIEKSQVGERRQTGRGGRVLREFRR